MALRRVFDKGDTEACKGVALILLLWHHLFFLHAEYGATVQLTALLAKVCVAIFVLLSGYALTASCRTGRTSLLSFYRSRLSRLYLNYWLIAAIFIAIGVGSGLRPIAAAHETRPCLKLALQLLGLDQYLLGGEGYNATWWFMGLIVPLYLFFPFLNDLTRKYGWWFLLPSAALLVDKGFRIPMLQLWLFPFCLGIYAAQRDSLAQASARLAALGVGRFAALAAALGVVACLRQTTFGGGEQIDALFGAIVIVLCFELSGSLPRLKSALAFLGRHLFNIFLFHTFIFYYYWPRLTYAPRNPLLILGLLLCGCIAVSMAIEAVKSLAGYPRLLAAIERLPLPDSPTL